MAVGVRRIGERKKMMKILEIKLTTLEAEALGKRLLEDVEEARDHGRMCVTVRSVDDMKKEVNLIIVPTEEEYEHLMGKAKLSEGLSKSLSNIKGGVQMPPAQPKPKPKMDGVKYQKRQKRY